MSEASAYKKIADKLTKRGWIERSIIHDKGESGVLPTIIWTEEGQEKLRQLFDLYEDAGYGAGWVYDLGELGCLARFVSHYGKPPAPPGDLRTPETWPRL